MRYLFIFILAIFVTALHAQKETGNWKTWFIESGKDFLLPRPTGASELTAVKTAQQRIDATMKEQIQFWNAGAPGYRWNKIMGGLWMMDTSYNGILSNMLLSVAIYDATIAAWNTKYAYNIQRPFEADDKIKTFAPRPETPSYPCEYSVAAGVASTIISHFYPHMKDSLVKLSHSLMEARVAMGLQYPRDTRDGFELGKRIAEEEIARTIKFLPQVPWDRKMPQKEGTWKGQFALYPVAGQMKTVILQSGNEFRPAPPPDFKKDMEELKNFKKNFSSNSNAYLHASRAVLSDIVDEKLFETNLHLDPPRAARIHAMIAIGNYDGFISCWDAKYAYFGIRPVQYDTTYKSLIGTPPFPGYPSGHAMLSSVQAELLSYFFPAEQSRYRKIAKEVAESRFHAGIHFRTDNEVATEMGKQVAHRIIQRIKAEGID